VLSRTDSVEARGLTFAVHRTIPASPHERLVVFLHGFQDSGATFGETARALAERGLEVLAPDQRGFGRSQWVSGDAYYHFPDYVADLDALLSIVAKDRPIALVGHSMGGTVASLFAGARPDRVASLALVEGIGPPDMPASLMLERTRSWLDGLASAPRRHEPFATEAEALDRFARHHQDVPREVLASILPHLLSPSPDGGAGAWSFDPLHRTRSPMPFAADALKAFLREVRCPALWVSGGPRGFHPPDEEERLACLRDLKRAVIDCGHMIHWVRPRELADLLGPHVIS